MRLKLIFAAVLISVQVMTGMPSHPLSRTQSYQTFRNIPLPVDANIVNTVFQDDAGMVWMGQLTVIVQGSHEPGEMTVEVEAKGLKKAVCEISVR